MTLPLAISSYFVIWWIVLFAILPFGVRSSAEAGLDRPAGTDAGAPLAANLGLKAIATTVVSGVVLAGLYAYMVRAG